MSKRYGWMMAGWLSVHCSLFTVHSALLDMDGVCIGRRGKNEGSCVGWVWARWVMGDGGME